MGPTFYGLKRPTNQIRHCDRLFLVALIAGDHSSCLGRTGCSRSTLHRRSPDSTDTLGGLQKDAFIDVMLKQREELTFIAGLTVLFATFRGSGLSGLDSDSLLSLR